MAARKLADFETQKIEGVPEVSGSSERIIYYSKKLSEAL